MLLREYTAADPTSETPLYQQIEASKRESSIGYSEMKKLLDDKKPKRIASKNLSDSYTGPFTTTHEGVKFECFSVPRSGSDRLYVFFSGGRPAGQTAFRRWSYYRILDGHTLSIDDPMVKIYPELTLGWYYGTKEENYLDKTVSLVLAYADAVSVPHSNIAFICSSGGGPAGIYCAAHIPGSTVLAINAQIRFDLYPYHKTVENIVDLDFSAPDPWNRNDLLTMITESTESRFVLVENVRSPADMEQLATVEEKVGKKARFGIDRIAPHIVTWLYDAPGISKAKGPHSSQDWSTMFRPIDFLVRNFETAEQYEELYLMFSELWFEEYDRQRREILKQNQESPEPEREFAAEDIPLPGRGFAWKKEETEIVCEVPARANRFNFRSPATLEPGKAYRIRMTGVDGTAETFTALLYGKNSRGHGKPRKFTCGKRHTLCFQIPPNADEVRLMFYPVQIGKASGESVTVKVEIETAKYNPNFESEK